MCYDGLDWIVMYFGASLALDVPEEGEHCMRQALIFA